MTKPKMSGGRLVVKAHITLRLALEEGCGFAINRLEDCGWHYAGSEYEAARREVLDRMVNELSCAIYEYFYVEGEP